ncbi:hypothetical protein [Hymenobacter sp. BRD67]|uniref:hypothetical protein n=1 Tax=Hymenobacter sp. BRD67 TaxID=2675877 RepID=UPI00156576D1|nr:hypothetical protein [Hymenobacter sp. BRD67]QKG53981.1 hypothetical protein GKZ67_16945 [Hymenobacter sp. BRD67]
MKLSNLRSKPLIWGIAFFVTGVFFLLYGSSVISAKSYSKYLNSQISGTVQDIEGFNRGFPILSIDRNNLYIHYLPPEFGKYILPGDSIFKPKGSLAVTSFRKHKLCVESIVWKYSIINGYEQPDITKKTICKYPFTF